MATEIRKVWTAAEIAELTRTAVEDVVAEVEARRLRGFRIGSELRVTDQALQAFMDGGPASEAGGGVPASPPPIPPAPPAAMQLTAAWAPRPKFTYLWPDGKTRESYEEAYEADVTLPSGQQHFVIGYTNRKSAGMNRRRVIVFLGRVPQIVPVVEFSGANDFATSKRVASVIKDAGNKHVRSQADLPVEYQGFPTVIYSDVVVGPYAARSMAVLAQDDDRDLMLRHAIVRAKAKGMIHG